jgi:hypothetical protein
LKSDRTIANQQRYYGRNEVSDLNSTQRPGTWVKEKTAKKRPRKSQP